MTRTVGHQDRSELIPDPAEALRRGRVLDAMLASARIPQPRGVVRATNGQTYESLQDHVRSVVVDGVDIRTLDIEGLLKTKTDHRAKDRIDRDVLQQLRARL